MKRRLELIEENDDGKKKISKLYQDEESQNLINKPLNNLFSFPYKPYDTQLKLMNDLYNIVKNKQIGILESPTGTGKTLTSLCSVLTFLEDENQKIKEEINNNRKKADELKNSTVECNFDDVLEKFKEADLLQQTADNEEDKLEKITKRIAEARSRYDYYNATDEIDIEDCTKDFLTEEEESSPELLKIVYATRTHTQIEQLTDELKKTRFVPRVVSLGSRSILCPNKEVNSLCNAASGDKCRELREKNKCSYYKRPKVSLLADHILAGVVRDINDVKEKSNSLNSCGYYASRMALPFCDLIFVPYATLFDEDMRKSVGLNIDNKTIIIVDEAHNLFANLTDMSSCTINLTQLTVGLEILTKFFNDKHDRTKIYDFKSLKFFEMAMKKAISLMDDSYWMKKDKKHFPVHQFVNEVLGTDILRMLQSFDAIKKENLLSRIQSFYRSKHYNDLKENNESEKLEKPSSAQLFIQKMSKKQKVEKTTIKVEEKKEEKSEMFPLFQLLEFFTSVCNANDNFEVIVDIVSNPKQYRLLCLNGGEKFKSVVSNARSTLLIGGTMKPSELVISMLTEDCGIERSRIVEYSYNHIIGAKNLRVVAVSGDTKGPLTLTHETLNKNDVYLRILDSLIPLINVVNNGLVVFFPSKKFIVNFISTVKQSGGENFKKLMSRNLFIEGSNPDVFEKYTQMAKKSKATLFGVMGGKFSEGVNFSDELSRCVVVVGLPYPNTFTPEFQSKIEYLKKHFKDEKIGSRLPINICMTQVNQAIGRVVRHSNDYGIVVLLDNRYSESRHLDLISNWAKPTIMKFSTTNELVQKFKSFKGFTVT